MTDRFDPKATPICDREERPAGHFSDHVVVVHSSIIAVDLERRARISEERLRLAMDILNAIALYETAPVSGLAARCLQRIEKVEE